MSTPKACSPARSAAAAIFVVWGTTLSYTYSALSFPAAGKACLHAALTAAGLELPVVVAPVVAAVVPLVVAGVEVLDPLLLLSLPHAARPSDARRAMKRTTERM